MGEHTLRSSLLGGPPHARKPDSLLGTVLGNSYLVDRKIAEGGMGAVFEARHLRTHGRVAIKVLQQEAACTPEILKHFLVEARVLSGLNHPHILQVFDCYLEGRRPYVVMELLHGEDLQQRLGRTGPLSLSDALAICRQAGGALHVVHNQRIVHRDIKPSNLFLCRHEMADHAADHVKVVDFGIAKIRDSAVANTATGKVMGSPHYLAPEIIRPVGPPDGRADQFSLAVTLFQALSGHLPFPGDGVGEVMCRVLFDAPPLLSTFRPDLPPYLSQVLGRALSKDPAARFPTIADFVKAMINPSLQQIAPTFLPRAGALGFTMPGSGALPVVPLDHEGTLQEGVGRPPTEEISSLDLSPATPSGGIPAARAGADEATRAVPLPSTRLPVPQLQPHDPTLAQLLPLPRASDMITLSPRGSSGLALLRGAETVAMLQPVLPRRRRSLRLAVPALAFVLAVPGVIFGPGLLRRATAPRAAPRGAAKVRHQLDSVPAGATVLDAASGAVLGQTPWIAEWPQAPGRQRLLVRKDGYKPAAYELERGHDSHEEVELQAEPRAPAPPPVRRAAPPPPAAAPRPPRPGPMPVPF